MAPSEKNEIENFIRLLSKLPGLGPRSGRRAALDLLGFGAVHEQRGHSGQDGGRRREFKTAQHGRREIEWYAVSRLGRCARKYRVAVRS